MYDAFVLGFGFTFGVAAAAGCIVVVMALCVAANNVIQRKAAEQKAVGVVEAFKNHDQDMH